jgi:hypothetical protein
MSQNSFSLNVCGAFRFNGRSNARWKRRARIILSGRQSTTKRRRARQLAEEQRGGVPAHGAGEGGATERSSLDDAEMRRRSRSGTAWPGRRCRPPGGGVVRARAVRYVGRPSTRRVPRRGTTSLAWTSTDRSRVISHRVAAPGVWQGHVPSQRSLNHRLTSVHNREVARNP